MYINEINYCCDELKAHFGFIILENKKLYLDLNFGDKLDSILLPLNYCPVCGKPIKIKEKNNKLKEIENETN